MVDEALSALGLTGSPEQSDIRRAYLRKVKEHPPERDAEGFRRVREAYDLLKDNPWLLLQRASAPAAGVPSEAREPEHDEPLDEGGEVDDGSFPQFDDEQFATLERALERDEPVVAAVAMLDMYERPALERAPAPPPFLVLRTYLDLVARDHLQLASSLLTAFEQRLGAEQVTLGSEVGARWKLAREVRATLEVDKPLGRALASGLRSGQLESAHAEANAAYRRHRGVLEVHMVKHAPTLWSSFEAELKTRPKWPTSGLGLGGKSLWVVGLICLKLVYFCSTSWISSSAEKASQRETAPEQRQREQLARSQSAREAAWGGVQLGLEEGNCAAVGAALADYRAASGIVDAQLRGRLLSSCPGLTLD